jgi:hypothetical protein
MKPSPPPPRRGAREELCLGTHNGPDSADWRPAPRLPRQAAGSPGSRRGLESGFEGFPTTLLPW